MRIHGLEPCQGETVFAFLVLRFSRPIARDALVEVISRISAIVPDVDGFLETLPDGEEPFRLLGMPWQPPVVGDEVDIQRRLIEAAADDGVEEAWFFQTGTSLPSIDDDGDDELDDDDDDESTGDAEVYVDQSEDPDVYADDGEGTQPVQLYPPPGTDEDDDEDDEEDETWSHGPPPVVSAVRFPVDGYRAILEELDWEDVGIAFKLGGDALAGEATVLAGFHALWLAPYGGRYRNAAVTIDRAHHAAHLWVDRFAVPSSAEEQVGHLLWVLSKLDEVVPVVHARFAGATMQQKYGGLMGDTSEPFVLGGNPLLAVHAQGGEAAVDAWLAGQQAWTNEELAQMLRELAIDIVTGDDDEDEDGDEDADAVDALFEDEDAVDALFEDDEAKRTTRMPALTVASDEDEAQRTTRMPALAVDAADDEEEAEADDDAPDRNRYIARYAAELLAARAREGVLDARAAEKLRPLLAVSERYEHRRTAVVQILGALKDAASVPALIQVLETSPIKTMTDSITKDDLLAATATALGEIADPTAIPALAGVIIQPGHHADDPRAPAAHALATCLAAAPEPRDVPDAVIDAMLATIAERNDGALNAELHFAYGRIARAVTPARRELMRARLAEAPTARSDTTPTFARSLAFGMASGNLDARNPDLRAGMHRALGEVDYNHEYTVRNIRLALRIAALCPELVEAEDLRWLVTFDEPDIRRAAHELLATLGAPMPAAAVFDRTTVGGLPDSVLVERIGDPHVVGRAALVGEAGTRTLAAARGPIVKAAHAAIERARPHGELLEPEGKLLAGAVEVLRAGPLDADVIALFERMLRHTNHHVKWELLQEPPDDDRLISAMFVVLAEKWGWQHSTAKEWLAARQGTPAYEAARKGAVVIEDDAVDVDDDDDEMN